MSALGQKRTYAAQKDMSALPLKADMCSATGHVCFGPKADMRRDVSVKREPRVPLAGPREDDGKCAPCLSYPPPAQRSLREVGADANGETHMEADQDPPRR